MPQRHSNSPFTFELEFSETLRESFSYRTLAGDGQPSAFSVSGGRVTGARRLLQGDDENKRWEITVAPEGAGDVAFTLPAGTDCTAATAICTEDGVPLSASVTDTVAGPAELTVEFEEGHAPPAGHDGSSAFTFRIAFSDEPHELGFETLRDESLNIYQGRRITATKARRLVQRSNRRWEVTVTPISTADITVSLGPTTDCGDSGAVCTESGQKLANQLHRTIQGPLGFSVADARVAESGDETLDFVVRLSRAAAGTETVDYRTSDGTATAGVDYTAASGTLTFSASETTKTVSVSILDDSHDEGEETLTLTLSNPSTGVVTAASATGTIENHDPLPRALMARFGRTAAVHVAEQVEERLAAPREPGFDGRIAGRQLRPGMERDLAVAFLGQLGGSVGVNAGVSGVQGPGSGSSASALGMPGPTGIAAGRVAAGGPLGGAAPGMPTRVMAAAGGEPHGLLDMGLGGGDLLTESAFALSRETRRGGILSFWSRGARSSFTGQEGDLGLDGDVRTTMFGADYARGPLLVGLSLANSRGLGSYIGVDVGQVTSSVTGLYPWLGYKATERVTVWGVAGYGAGALMLTPGAGAALESGLSMWMAATGTRSELITGGGGFGLAFKADALWVGTAFDGVEGPSGRLAATAAAASRLRTGLEGSRSFTFAGRLSLTPSVEVGLRHDGGDAETGAGMDVGWGLAVSDPRTGLAVDVQVRTLVVHQAEGFRERGVAFSLSYNPAPATPLGLVARVAPSWGGHRGAESLWGQETMAGMTPDGFAGGGRLDAEVGYGLPVGDRLVGSPRVVVGTSEYGQSYGLGYSLDLLDAGDVAFKLGLEAQRREAPLLEGAVNGFLGRATLGW